MEIVNSRKATFAKVERVGSADMDLIRDAIGREFEVERKWASALRERIYIRKNGEIIESVDHGMYIMRAGRRDPFVVSRYMFRVVYGGKNFFAKEGGLGKKNSGQVSPKRIRAVFVNSVGKECVNAIQELLGGDFEVYNPISDNGDCGYILVKGKDGGCLIKAGVWVIKRNSHFTTLSPRAFSNIFSHKGGEIHATKKHPI